MANNKTNKCKYKSTSGKTIDGSLVLVEVVVAVAGLAPWAGFKLDDEEMEVNGGTGVELVVEVWLLGSFLTVVLSSVSIG